MSPVPAQQGSARSSGRVERTRRKLRVGAIGAAGLALAVTALGPAIAAIVPTPKAQIPYASPSAGSPLGSDHVGDDVLHLLLTGGWRLVLVAALIAVLVTAAAMTIGAVAALRPRVGVVIERTNDAMILVPPILAIMLVMLSWPGSGLWGVVLVAVVVGTPFSARVFAAAAATVAASGYVEVAEANGERLGHLVLREVLPNIRHTAVTQLGLRFVESMYVVTAAAFLRLPAGFGDDNWAVMVRDNSPGMMLNPWSVIAPSLATGVLAAGVNLAIRGRR